jgi:preprotein translocase subunit SecG
MTILFTILHVIVSLFLILVVLAQQGKGQDLASAFGGGGSQTAFGARGTATLLSKITAGAAVTFMVTSLALSYLRPVTQTRTVVPETAPAETPSETPAPGTESETTAPPATQGESTAPSEQTTAPAQSGSETETPAESGQQPSEPPPQ